MSKSEESMFLHAEERRDRKLAELLGITYNELQQTTWHFDEETSNDGLVYNLIVVFDEGSPKHILAKIEGIENNRYVYLSPNALEDGDEEDDREEWPTDDEGGPQLLH